MSFEDSIDNIFFSFSLQYRLSILLYSKIMKSHHSFVPPLNWLIHVSQVVVSFTFYPIITSEYMLIYVDNVKSPRKCSNYDKSSLFICRINYCNYTWQLKTSTVVLFFQTWSGKSSMWVQLRVRNMTRSWTLSSLARYQLADTCLFFRWENVSVFLQFHCSLKVECIEYQI